MSDRNELAKSATEAGDPAEGIITREEILEQIHNYELQYGMSSEEFLRQWKADIAPDTYETNVWAMLLDVL